MKNPSITNINCYKCELIFIHKAYLFLIDTVYYKYAAHSLLYHDNRTSYISLIIKIGIRKAFFLSN